MTLRLLRTVKLLFRSSSTLVIAEENGNLLSDATKSAITASSTFQNDVTCLVASSKHAKTLSEQTSSLTGIKEVLICEDPNLHTAGLASLILHLVKEGSFTHIIGGSSSLMRDCLGHVSAKLGVSMLSDVTSVINSDTFERRQFAGNVIATVKSLDNIKVMTVRSFSPPAESQSRASSRIVLPIHTPSNISVISRDIPESERPSLTTAKVVVSGGRGLKTAEKFSLVYELADSLNGAVGATRAAVDLGFVSNDLQVGQTGKVVSPQLYICVGMSGAIQHLAGMRDSKVVVAIDKNESAPIFDNCDYGIVGDLFEIVPQLTAFIKDSRIKC